MNNIKHIFKKEVSSYFNSPMAYIFLVIFAIVNSFFFTNIFFKINQSDLRTLFNIIPLVYLFFIPAICMGLIAKEKNTGTMEVLTTLPITDRQLVIGKFLSALFLIFVGLLFTFIQLYTLIQTGTDIDYGAIFTGYLGLLLLGAVYSSIGIFASSVSNDQIVAFIIGVFLVLIFYLMDKTILLFTPPFMASFIQYLAVDYHLTNISRGVIDSRNIIYFLSVISFFLFMTIRLLESRKWK
jgi:ABC-2 type transport system permease protein